ncbi:MAG: hypothetical protein CMF55_00425 [Legionellales bacterium]|nr:hypothetical protein [Legionellales bacterium]
MGDLVIEDGDTLFSTNITVNSIRALLNHPRGLNSGTIIEYVNLRNTQIAKKSRKANYVGVNSTNAPTTAEIETAVKMVVCVDCLRVLVDTIPAVVPEKEQGVSDIRFNKQLASFEKQAEDALRVIEEVGATAFYKKATAAKVSGTKSGQLSGSLYE